MALRSGTVPSSGLEQIAVGLDPQVEAVEELFEYVSAGRSAYKFIRGEYGAGKTFLSTLLCSRALDQGFLTSYVVISKTDAPLHKLEKVYRKLCLELCSRGHPKGALQSVLDRWLYGLEESVISLAGLSEDDPAFPEAVARRVEQALQPLGEKAGRMMACLQAYHACGLRDDYSSRRALLDWLCGDPKVHHSIKKLAGISGALDATDVLVFLRGLLELIQATGHRGLVLVLDEVETVSTYRKNERQTSLELIRTLVDGIDKNEFPGLLLLVTGTPDFFEGALGVPELVPLHDRIRVEFSDDRADNLRMPQIRLRSFDAPRLLAVARKVRDIYPATHPERIHRRVDEALIQDMVDTVTRGFGGQIAVVPRLFLREFLDVLDRVDLHDEDPRRHYSFDADRVACSVLTAEEERYLDREARALYL